MSSSFRSAVILTLACACLLTLFSQLALAADPPEPATCNQAAREPLTYVDGPGRPFEPIATQDGCWIFVSLTNMKSGSSGGIAVLRRNHGKVSLVRVIPVEGHPTGMVRTHDGKLLIVANGDRVDFLDIGRMISGAEGALLGGLSEGGRLGVIYVNVTADDRFLFVSNEGAQSISVVDLKKARSTGFKPDSVIGRIPAGLAPIALTFSPDGRYLYTTSEAAASSWGWPADCRLPGGNRAADERPPHPHGAILVVDVARAISDPANSVVAKVPAGCSPVRLEISPEGDVAYVTARTDDALLAFNTAKLLTDPEHALIAKVPVGVAPVGLAVIDHGRRIVVTNSNRFSAKPNEKQDLTVIDASKISGAKAVLGSIPAGGFPRELRVTADQRTLLLTNFTSNTLELIDIPRLPVR